MERKREQKSQRQIQGMSGIITYELTRKSVKNINLRVRRDGSVAVSASRRVPVKFIDEWIRSKEEFILQAQERNAEREQQRQKELDTGANADFDLLDKEKALAVFQEIGQEVWQTLKQNGVQKPEVYPRIRVRTMKSRWGSCIPSKNVITLNTRLLLKQRHLVEYVVLHEFAHFTHPDHSPRFYGLVASMMPDWKERKKELNQ